MVYNKNEKTFFKNYNNELNHYWILNSANAIIISRFANGIFKFPLSTVHNITYFINFNFFFFVLQRFLGTNWPKIAVAQQLCLSGRWLIFFFFFLCKYLVTDVFSLDTFWKIFLNHNIKGTGHNAITFCRTTRNSKF